MYFYNMFIFQVADAGRFLLTRIMIKQIDTKMWTPGFYKIQEENKNRWKNPVKKILNANGLLIHK